VVSAIDTEDTQKNTAFIYKQKRRCCKEVSLHSASLSSPPKKNSTIYSTLVRPKNGKQHLRDRKPFIASRILKQSTPSDMKSTFQAIASVSAEDNRLQRAFGGRLLQPPLPLPPPPLRAASRFDLEKSLTLRDSLLIAAHLCRRCGGGWEGGKGPPPDIAPRRRTLCAK